MQEETMESEKMIKPEELKKTEEKVTKNGKPRKQFEWTPKRQEAFDKMRKGLEEKVTLTKQLKEEKKKTEKELIKSKVREIMASKKGPVIQEEDSDSFSESEESEEEVRPPPKQMKKRAKTHREVAPPPPRKNEKRKEVEILQDSDSSDSDPDACEMVDPHRNYTPSQHRNYQREKVDRGKAIKVAQFVNPMDRFILL